MSDFLPWPTKEVDVDFLVFVERHATDLLRLDILTFWGKHPHFAGVVEELAQKLGRSSQSIRPELGDLALIGILDVHNLENGQTQYQLCQEPEVRRMIRKLADSQ